MSSRHYQAIIQQELENLYKGSPEQPHGAPGPQQSKR